MKKPTIINFGQIGGRRAVTFKVSNDGLVVRKGWQDVAQFVGSADALEMGIAIPARESFRRWKISRKAWKTRRASQLLLPL